ncbi:COG4705 family protein [Acidisoma cladoniae]|jgi:uncharacterized membrane-anchored protein|uniref:COG4705 family protein n=1 Tax=Acidisoma cladoniae TaxID=3040935 RepID=UPI00254E1803|nr:hypothetical protein [Acidisoma sp. PAMC 29798]
MSAVVSSSESRAGAFARVPAITAYFWIIKFLTTAMGEAASDYAVHRSPLEAVALGAAGLAAALAIQFSLRRYLAWSYWLVVAMISVFGTMAADLVHKAGVPHPVSTLVFAILLAATFILWNAVEKSLSVHSIFTLRREMFYWVTVFVSFAFGTAAGDWTAGSLHLGNLLSGVLFAILFVIPAIGYWKFGWNDIFAFWFAYVMTRPLGASFADWFGKPASHGGLGYGQGLVCVVLTFFIVMLVAYLSVSKRDVSPHSPPQLGRGTAF